VFERIKSYLASPPVLQAPRAGYDFKLYVEAQEHMVGTVLMQEVGGKEFAVEYLSRRLLGTEVRYTFVKKLCLSLYFACMKLCRYLLMSSCTVVCQYNVIKCMLKRPILSGRLGKRVHTLVEFDLRYESLRAMKVQVVAKFIVDHSIELGDVMCVDDAGVWSLFLTVLYAVVVWE
jgi:hypothetical protein